VIHGDACPLGGDSRQAAVRVAEHQEPVRAFPFKYFLDTGDERPDLLAERTFRAQLNVGVPDTKLLEEQVA
jgi:hypothetical protein